MTTQTIPAPRRKLLTDVAILAALAGLGTAGYLWAPALAPKSDIALPLSTCDLGRGPCRVELPGGGAIDIAIEPRPIPALKPLHLSVSAHGAKVQGVEIDFAGVDMKMGVNRPRLEAQGDGRFSGQTSLPICTTGGMQWETTVIVDIPGARVAAPFRFESGHS